MLNQNGCATTNELIIKYRTWNEFGNHPAADIGIAMLQNLVWKARRIFAAPKK
jgi:hypothetical protein